MSLRIYVGGYMHGKTSPQSFDKSLIDTLPDYMKGSIRMDGVEILVWYYLPDKAEPSKADESWNSLVAAVGRDWLIHNCT